MQMDLHRLPPEKQERLQPKVRQAELQACQKLKEEQRKGVRPETYREEGGAEKSASLRSTVQLLLPDPSIKSFVVYPGPRSPSKSSHHLTLQPSLLSFYSLTDSSRLYTRLLLLFAQYLRFTNGHLDENATT